MSETDRLRWNERYQHRVQKAYPEPRPLLVQYAPPASPGQRALDVACGQGQHALYLAEQGYTVDAVDVSAVAVERAQHEMAQRGLHVNFGVIDLDHHQFSAHHYDLICVFYFLDRSLIGSLKAALRPGGMFIYETMNIGWLDSSPDSHHDYLLQLGELASFFEGWETLLFADGSNRSRYVGRKPL